MSISEAAVAPIRPYPQPQRPDSRAAAFTPSCCNRSRMPVCSSAAPVTTSAGSRSRPALLAAGWTAFVLLGDSWWQLVVAVFLAVVFTQIGFIGHDAGHRQIFRHPPRPTTCSGCCTATWRSG